MDSRRQGWRCRPEVGVMRLMAKRSPMRITQGLQPALQETSSCRSSFGPLGHAPRTGAVEVLASRLPALTVGETECGEHAALAEYRGRDPSHRPTGRREVRG